LRLLTVLLTAVVGAAVAGPSGETRLDVGSTAWRRCVRGARSGSLARDAVVVLPGADRSHPRRVTVQTSPGAATALAVAVDDGEPTRVALAGGTTASVDVPPAAYPGLRLVLRSEEAGGVAPTLRSVILGPAPRAPWIPWLAAAGAASATVVGLRLGVAGAAGFGLFCAGLLALASLSIPDWLVLPSSWRALALPVLLLGVGATGLVAAAGRRAATRWLVLATAFVLGSWLRLFFLPAPGSWDTEYWRAWTHRAVDSGLGLVYGPPEALPDGHFLAQLSGREERWEVVERGRSYPVDYPPLAMALWAGCQRLVARAAPGLEAREADYVAVKIGAVVGDALATLVLALAAGSRGRGLALAAAYWMLPMSWLSSAALGYLDGAVAPLVALALLAAGAGRPASAGALLAAGALVKPTALIVAPAVVVALLRSGGPAPRAGARLLAPAALAALSVAAVVSLPFLQAGTLATALVHCYRILPQGQLSGGFPNLWWLVGHALNVASGTASLAGPVDHAAVGLLSVPAQPVGTLLFALAAVPILRAQARGPRGAALAGAGLLAAYGLLAVGVHENHVHPMFLLLLLTGLPSLRLTGVFAASSLVFVLGMLCQSGLGRFHCRFAFYKPFLGPVDALRMAPGFDLSLALAVLNLATVGAMLPAANAERGTLEDRPRREAPG